MTQLDGKSMNIIEQNIEKLKEIFPEVFNEGKIDFSKLEEELGQFKEDENERYNFTWNGKSEAKKIALTPSTGTLRPSEFYEDGREDSKNFNTTQNLYIEGDNLEVLKLLQKSYHKKVKMIYIDPPYNTGKDFVYKDNFRDNIKNYMEITGQVDSEGNKLSTNSEINGRYHSDWLNMMYPRLKLARNLLKDDGIIFISIDDNEVANLRKLCDEIFGEDNFIDNMIWKKRYGGGAKEKYLVTLHEYVLVYTKNIQEFGEIFVPLNEESIKRYYKLKDSNFETRGPYRTHPLEAGKAVDERPNLVFDIPAPDGTMITPKRQWYWSKDRVEEAIEKNELEFVKGKNNEWTVHSKQYLMDENGIQRQSKAFSIIDNVYSQHGTNEILEILGNAKIFSYPKPIDLLTQLLSIGLEPKSDDIILDFFSVSSGIAHSVMKLNSEDDGNRKFICVQLPESTDEKSEAYKAGYKNICEIGKERIRRAGEKVKTESGKDELDIGFKVLKLDSSNIKSWDSDFENLETNLLDAVENIKSDRNEEDLLYEILLKYGLDLTLPIEEKKVNGKKLYNIGFGALIICLDNNISIDITDEIITTKKEYDSEITRVVFKDSGFKNATEKTNIIKTLNQNGIDEVVSV
jgi:adenine-specific DNA-methyltransferase